MVQTTAPVPAAEPPVEPPALKISGLNFFYGESHILRDADLTVQRGEMTCLIGRNGVGKTTLLKNIVGLLKPRSGAIAFQGDPIQNLPPAARARRGIGYVPQGREIIPRLTVRENLLLGLEACRGTDRADASVRNRVIPQDAFELFPVLGEMLDRMGGDLSGGQQQQLAIARALVGKPSLLVLDEPTEGIQPSIVLQIEDAVRQIVETKGVSVLLVEQHLHFVRKADYYYAMQKGSMVASGLTRDLTNATIQEFLAV